MVQDLLDQVLRRDRLPSLPTIALRIIELVQQDDVEIQELAGAIIHDPALATKILRTANSPLYGRAQPVSTVGQAVVALGLNTVKTLALGFSLVPHLKGAGGQGFDHAMFWKRSIYSAVAARALAQQVRSIRPEEAFLAGLLQDLGMFAMSQALGAQYHDILRDAGVDHRALRGLEQARLQTDHAATGAALGQHWHLPRPLVESIRCHEAPSQAGADLTPLVRCVSVGNWVADIFVNAKNGETLNTVCRLAAEWFGLLREQAETLVREVRTAAQALGPLFDVPCADDTDIEQILARANESLQDLNLRQLTQSIALEDQNRHLTVQAQTDALTGLANRRRFDEFVVAAFAHSRASGRPLGLLFLDIDHFKKFNDVHGHPTGDQILLRVADILREWVPKSCLVARYGGEEFTVALPNIGPAAATSLAEGIRAAIERERTIADTGKPLRITISVGVATAEENAFASVEQLMKAADRGVYAAKGAGRNCVRIFSAKANG